MDQTKAQDGFKRLLERLSQMAVRKASGEAVLKVKVNQGGIASVVLGGEEHLN